LVEARAIELLERSPPQPPSLAIDAELPLAELTPALMNQLSRLEPFGAACEKPVFLSSDLRLAEPPRVIGQDGRHLALQVRRGATVHRALAFGQAARLSELRLGEPLHLVHTPRYSTFRGETRLELLAHDFACGPLPACS
jgi:single-stranded-DNA-specific exonuclease